VSVIRREKFIKSELTRLHKGWYSENRRFSLRRFEDEKNGKIDGSRPLQVEKRKVLPQADGCGNHLPTSLLGRSKSA
jgi:hypothetical protein